MKISQTATMTQQLWNSLGYADLPDTSLLFTGEGQLPSAFPVSQLAGASIATAGLAVAALIKAKHGLNPQVTVDQHLASLWFAWSLKPINWQLPSAWDAIAGDYQASDGWIRLHTNAPHHRSVVERLLGPHKHKAAVADAVSRWKVSELEHAVITSGGCAAQMHSHQHWQQHMQGKSAGKECRTRVNICRFRSSAGNRPHLGNPADAAIGRYASTRSHSCTGGPHRYPLSGWVRS
nr:hypothetical protein [Yersinia enterocolitica]